MDAVDHDGRRHPTDLEDPFHAKHIVAMGLSVKATEQMLRDMRQDAEEEPAERTESEPPAHKTAHVRGLEHWQALESQRILPRLLQVVQVLDEGLTGRIGETWQAWRSRYLPELQKLLGELRRQAALKSQQAAAGIAAAVDPLLPPERRGESLSRKALWVVASTPGVSCVLNGMRTAAYVDDALGILSWPALPDPIAVYEAVRDKA